MFILLNALYIWVKSVSFILNGFIDIKNVSSFGPSCTCISSFCVLHETRSISVQRGISVRLSSDWNYLKIPTLYPPVCGRSLGNYFLVGNMGLTRPITVTETYLSGHAKYVSVEKS